MSSHWLGRLRWRRRGAWLWPAFVALTVLDGVLGHLLPESGDAQGVVSGALVACFLNLIGVILLSRPIGALLRRRRPELPAVVARDYGGTSVIVAVSVILLLMGWLHHASVRSDQRAMREAIARAQAFIGDRAPARFRANLAVVSAVAIEPGSLYRACVPTRDRNQDYCVIVNTGLPFSVSVRFDGYEPNSVFAQGTG